MGIINVSEPFMYATGISATRSPLSLDSSQMTKRQLCYRGFRRTSSLQDAWDILYFSDRGIHAAIATLPSRTTGKREKKEGIQGKEKNSMITKP